VLLTGFVLIGTASVAAGLFTVDVLYHVYFSRQDLPELGPFTRFQFPAIGHVYDANGQPLIELATEYREITQYADIPPIVRETRSWQPKTSASSRTAAWIIRAFRG
jgi:membrane carboxypeptidase/penicillin-binding protein